MPSLKDIIMGDRENPAPTIAGQLMYEITTSPKPLTTFYLDYDTFSSDLMMMMLDSKDFSVFSNTFCTELKNAIAELDEPLYQKIKNNEYRLRIENFQHNSDTDDFDSVVKINELGSDHFNEMLLIRGTIVMITENKIKMKKTMFQCINCNTIIQLDFNSTGGVSLDKCACGEENSFRILPQSTSTINSQVLTIEELAIDSSKNPVSIDVLIDGDLVNKFEVGDIVVVTGNLRLDVFNEGIVAQFKRKVTTNSYTNNMLAAFGGSNNGIDFDYIVEANFVKKITEKSIKFHDLSEQEKEQIEKLKKNPHIIDVLVRSFCPKIWGEEIKKEALLYQLVGGLGRSIAPEIDNRGEIHILLFGDASTGKTRLMLFSQQMSSKTRYGVGEGVSRPGLAGGVDTVDNKRVLTAGDARLADMGLLILDEVSDIPDDALNALKEIMEKQTATTTKIRHGTFKTRTSVLAGSNPKNGNSYNPKKNFNENIGLSHALMTRFDAIFLFRDIPGLYDDQIADTILKSYKPEDFDIERDGIVSKELLAKYIFLAKNSGIIPKFTPDAEQSIKDYYTRLRKMNLSQIIDSKIQEADEDIPIVSFSSRQFQSLLRFSTARTRLLFKEQTDTDDVEAAKKIISHMLHTIGIDIETGKIDMHSIFSAKTANQENRENQFFSVLEKLSAARNNKVNETEFITELRKQSKWRDLPITKIEKDIRGYEMRDTINVINGIISLNYEQHNYR